MPLQSSPLHQKSTVTHSKCDGRMPFQFLYQTRVRKLVRVFSMLIVLFILTTHLAFAQTNNNTPNRVETKHTIMTIQELERQGNITHAEAEKSIAYSLTQASRAAGHTLSLNEIMATPDPTPQQLTPLQAFAGAIDFLRIILVLGSIATAGAVVYLFKYSVKKLLQFLKNVSVVVYEIVFYAASLGCSIWGWLLPEPMHNSLGFLGSLLFAGALGFSANHHRYLANTFRFSGLLFLVWTLAALLFGSSFIGFMAVGALLSTLGFSVIITPLCYGFGFKDKTTIGRTTIAAFAILALFIGLRLFSALIPALAVFEWGALFLGSFVGYTGLLISSSRWYKDKKNYWGFQIVTIIAGVSALFFGSIFHIDELQKIGGTFFILYCIEKLMEIPTKSKLAFALLLAIVGITTIGFCWFALTHQEVFQQFLFTLNYYVA